MCVRAVLLAVVLVAGAAGPPSPTPTPVEDNTHPCPIEGYGSLKVCAAFRDVPIRTLTVIPSWRFPQGQQPEGASALADGSVLVNTDYQALYRIISGHITTIWPPPERCKHSKHFWFGLAGSFDDQAVLKHGDSVAGVRPDGSLSFDRDYLSNLVSVVQADGIIWFFRRNDQGYSLDAYDPRTRKAVEVDVPGIESFFGSPNRHAYAGTRKGLYEMKARPTPRAQLVRASYEDALPQGVGPDGSFWASTITDVIHVHRDGAVHVMQFIPPITSGSSLRREPISLNMAPDGSMWIQWTGLIRITNDDRIQRLEFPREGDWSRPISFGPDSSVWLVARANLNDVEGVVQFVPSPFGGGTPASPFGAPPPSPTPTITRPCPPPTPLPTPKPALPPKTVSVDFVYAVNSNSNDIWGYWAGPDGRLHPVRGSPFPVGMTAVTVAIDPTGRFLYAGDGHSTITGYAIDAVRGSLRPIPGSPFATSWGPTMVAVTPSGRYVYAVNINSRNVSVYSIDKKSGQLRAVSGSPFAVDRVPFRIAMNPKRDVAYVVTDAAIETFNIANGGFSRIATTPVAEGRPGDIAIDAQGRWAFLTNEVSKVIYSYRIGGADGTLQPASRQAAALQNGPRDVVLSPRGSFAYVHSVGAPPNIFGFSVDQATGALAVIPGSPFGGADSPQMVSVTPDGAFLYATNFDSKYVSGFAIDRRTGALRHLPGSPFPGGERGWGIVSCRRTGGTCKP